MGISEKDVQLEKRAEREDLAEVHELTAALDILRWEQRGSISKSPLERATRLVLDARVHNAKLMHFSEKLFKDISQFRGFSGRQRGKDRFLTSEEGRILATAKNINPHLSNIANNLEYMIHLIKTHGTMEGVIRSYDKVYNELDLKLNSVSRDVNNLIGILRGLFALEKQLEEALKR